MSEQLIAEKWPEAKTTESGLKYVVTAEGAGGDKPQRGQAVKAHYSGYLLDGSKFDSSVDRGQPFEFPVGMSMVIAGWDEAFLDMTKGEKRTLIIPPQLGYGERGFPPVIPGNSHLVFDVELIDY
ncbi:FKBP-type peptidyl-prolyl cis-trans isomerase [Persicirhabdus sediminis]|uniref:Peptidyl-prolyl cis-trans isomerase n=1 Tax=Persicirhabdus sediminis TaxID=454144 RepID=A0A8J7SK74_9BACT|nr:FKBP-type peptidyl-prolyl cis-trans isomerase [Persicirhabdus sediminis]MBK1789618.1 FKBP-type peptidyl-prolyl cis-trans isomerase [Persicirhabdus sediminis]